MRDRYKFDGEVYLNGLLIQTYSTCIIFHFLSYFRFILYDVYLVIELSQKQERKSRISLWPLILSCSYI